jgi:DNA/RNA-binding domain of Phe-tRNA-synthetase-like protein
MMCLKFSTQDDGMHFCHTAQIWQEFPQLVPGLLVAEGINPAVTVGNHLQPWYQLARERLSQGQESQLPEISAWRRAYTQMGLKPTQYRSAAEALLRRFRQEGDLPQLHPLVDLCNAISIAFALPVAVFDLDHVDRFLEVRYARGTETYLAFNGETEIPPANEVIFADASDHVHARRWTFRQSRQSVIVPATTRVLIVSEGLHPTANTDVAALIDSLAGEIATHWSPPVYRAMLTANSPRLDFTIRKD